MVCLLISPHPFPENSKSIASVVLQLSGNHGDVGRSRIELLWQFHHQLHNRWVLEERVHERMPSWAGTKGSHDQKVPVISHWHGICMKETFLVWSFMIYLTSIKTESMIWKSTIPFLDSYSFGVTALDGALQPASIRIELEAENVAFSFSCTLDWCYTLGHQIWERASLPC